MIIIYMILIGFFLAISMFKINHPHIKWGCFFGKHRYSYAGRRSGMTYNKDTDKVTGTMRKLYQCSCGTFKKAEDKDWN